jgi:hypothetical protein
VGTDSPTPKSSTCAIEFITDCFIYGDNLNVKNLVCSSVSFTDIYFVLGLQLPVRILSALFI